MANMITQHINQKAIIVWQTPEDWEMRVDALLIIPDESTVMLQQGERWVEVHKETIDDLCKILKVLNK